MAFLWPWISYSCVPMTFHLLMQTLAHWGFGKGRCITRFVSELSSLSSSFSGCDEWFSSNSLTIFCTTTLTFEVFMDCITCWFRMVISSQPLGEGHVSLTPVTAILVCWVYGHPPTPCRGASIFLHWSNDFLLQYRFLFVPRIKSMLGSFVFGFMQLRIFSYKNTICPFQSNLVWICVENVPAGHDSQISRGNITSVQQQLLLIAFCQVFVHSHHWQLLNFNLASVTNEVPKMDPRKSPKKAPKPAFWTRKLGLAGVRCLQTNLERHLEIRQWQLKSQEGALLEPMFHVHSPDQVNGVTSFLELFNLRCDVNLCSLWVITCRLRLWLLCCGRQDCEISLPLCIVSSTEWFDEMTSSLLHCFANSLSCWLLFWSDTVFLETLLSPHKSYKNVGVSIKLALLLFAARIRCYHIVCQKLLRATLLTYVLCTVRWWFFIHNLMRHITLPRTTSFCVHTSNHIARSCKWSFRFV